MSEKIIEIPEKEFKELLEKYEQCKADKEKLLAAIDSLNKQIDSYNEKFANNKK